MLFAVALVTACGGGTASAFGYCTPTPYGTTTSPDWAYEPHRIDLDKSLYWVDGATLGVVGQGDTGYPPDKGNHRMTFPKLTPIHVNRAN